MIIISYIWNNIITSQSVDFDKCLEANFYQVVIKQLTWVFREGYREIFVTLRSDIAGWKFDHYFLRLCLLSEFFQINELSSFNVWADASAAIVKTFVPGKKVFFSQSISYITASIFISKVFTTIDCQINVTEPINRLVHMVHKLAIRYARSAENNRLCKEWCE